MSNYTLKDIQKKRKEILLHLYMTNGNGFIIDTFEKNKIYSLVLYPQKILLNLTSIIKIYLKGMTKKNMEEIAKEVIIKIFKRMMSKYTYNEHYIRRLYPLSVEKYNTFAEKICKKRYGSINGKNKISIFFDIPYKKIEGNLIGNFIICYIEKNKNGKTSLKFLLYTKKHKITLK